MSGAAPREAEDGLRRDIAAFIDAQARRGGVNAVTLTVLEGDNAVRGRVLTERQGREVREIARRHRAETELEVVADPAAGLEEGWVVPVVDVLDLWREPGRAGDEMGRQTQYLRNVDGALRQLGREGDYVLVQGIDLAVGWARASDVREVDADGLKGAWAAARRAEEGRAVPAKAGTTAADVVLEGRRALGSPYVWGGTGGGGYDCSGLVQRAMAPAGVVLPRHTGDQRRVGLRVVADEVRAGDLLFARPLSQKVGHVVLMTSASTVLHACRTEHKVIEESLRANAERYAHQGWRRPVELAG